MSFPPEAYLLGAQKAGTTTLAFLLGQHPHITVSQPKEPHFFTHNWDRGLGWYKTKFPNPSNSVCLDASTSYSMAPLTKGHGRSARNNVFENVPEKAFSTNPEAKFIYLIRDPVERTYSGYWHSVRTGRENAEFESALLSNPSYLDISDYSGQLMLWLDRFPLDSFFFVRFEDLSAEPEQTTRECYEFLGVDRESSSIRLDSAKNQTRQVGGMGRRLNNLIAEHRNLRDKLDPLRSFVPEGVKTRLESLRFGTEPVPPMEEADRDFLIEYFRDRNQRLEKLIGIPLDGWRT